MEQELDRAMNEFLGLLDQGEYEQAYEKMSPTIRLLTDREEFKKQMSAFRAPLGKVIDRTLVSRSHSSTLQGLPDGEYHIVTFQTSLEHKARTQEIVAAEAKEGRYEILGYHLK